MARLVGAGRSNREIAGALRVTERTVENHVAHILAKLGFRSRAQIATWVGEAERRTAQSRPGESRRSEASGRPGHADLRAPPHHSEADRPARTAVGAQKSMRDQAARS